MRQNIILTIIAVAVLILVVAFGLYFWSLQSDTSALPPTSATASSSTALQPETPIAPSSVPSSTTMSHHLITLQTSLGDITFETYDSDAPKTVANFIDLATTGFYNNVIFHRIIKGFMIQGGDPTGTGRGGPGYAFADELNPSTPSYQAGYERGVVAMANAGPNTNGSQFFILLADTPLPHAYTIFGKVTKGQDVVDAIGNLPVDASDRPATPPVIKNVIVATEASSQ